MTRQSFSSVTEQVAETLLEGIRQRRWTGEMPGRVALARELGVNHKTVEAAMKTLEKAGWLERQGSGKGRRITPRETPTLSALRIQILCYEKNDVFRQDLLCLLNRLIAVGHLASFADKAMRQLDMDHHRIIRFVEKTEADAWIVVAGPRELLTWFASRPTPAFALYGSSPGVRLAAAGPEKSAARQELVARLIGLGHRLITMLVREERRKPAPGNPERIFLQQLEANGIKTSAYNLPDWGDTPEELHRILDSLFRHTPPTALIIDDMSLFLATMQHLAGIGIVAPTNVSLACTDANPDFEWCRPTITHIAWDTQPVINHVVNWANHISRGKDDRRRINCKARLVVGGTIGPVPKMAR
jgi:DNA-binding LacI/PurR family transcriptional regulator/DNA-binding transcriptional regulator YhcF (GntR family)